MHNIDLILTLTGGLAAALALGYVTHRLGLSPLVGYLLAGIAVGPYTPGFVADRHLAEQLAEVGVILLMFGVGLHFHLEDLLAVRRVAIPGAIVQSAVATGLGAWVARMFGWSVSAGVVFGLALSVASTVVLVRVLADHRDLHTPTGHIAVGWLVVEDLFTVIVLVLLPALFEAGSAGPADLALALGGVAVKMTLLVAVTFLVGGRLIPRLLERVSATRSRELFTLTVLVVALGLAVGSAKLFGVSMALGAFLAGMVVGKSEFSQRAASEALPLRDAFAVLFFVSVGMLLDPLHVLAAPVLVTTTLAVVLVGKPLAAVAIVALLGYPPRVALGVAVALGQIGEFSFLLAALGRDLGLLNEAGVHTIVAVAIVSITINPLLYRLVDRADAWLARHPRVRAALESRVRAGSPPGAGEAAAAPAGPAHRAIVVGYGPVGQNVARLLRENSIAVTVVELNLDTVRRLRAEGVAAVYGDAAQRETLEEAGVARAGSVILSSAGERNPEPIIRLARQLNPGVRILVRAAYARELAALRVAGAERAFSGEGEVALAMAVAILEHLGATPEQIDRERARVDADLHGVGTAGDDPAAPDAAPRP
jgi:K+:H+ antiporter